MTKPYSILRFLLRKPLLTMLVAGTHFVAAQAQTNWEWVQQATPASSSGNAWGRTLTIDGAGNTIVGASVQGRAATGSPATTTIAFGSATVTATSAQDYLSYKDGVVAKYNSTGTVQWVKYTAQNVIMRVATDAAGNVYVTAAGTKAFGNTDATWTTDERSLTKLDPSGNVLWTVRLGALQYGVQTSYYGWDRGTEPLAVDAAGNAYLGWNGVLAEKISPQGAVLWTIPSNQHVYGFALDRATGDLLATGGNNSSSAVSIMTFGSGTNTMTYSDARSFNIGVFLARITPAGTIVRAAPVGDLSASSPDIYRNAYGNDVASDAAGNLYLTSGQGIFSNPFPAGAGFTLTKLSSTGTRLWAKTFSRTSLPLTPAKLLVDVTGNAYLAGTLTGNATVDGVVLMVQPGSRAAETADAALLMFDNTGTARWGRTDGGSYADGLQDAALDNGGHLYVTGRFRQAASFGSFALTGSNAQGSSNNFDCYSLVVGRSALTVLAARPKRDASEVYLYPNPASGQVTVEAPTLRAGTAELRLFNALGQVVRQQIIPTTGGLRQTLALSGLAPGVYSLQVSTSQGSATQRLVVQ